MQAGAGHIESHAPPRHTPLAAPQRHQTGCAPAGVGHLRCEDTPDVRESQPTQSNRRGSACRASVTLHICECGVRDRAGRAQAPHHHTNTRRSSSSSRQQLHNSRAKDHTTHSSFDTRGACTPRFTGANARRGTYATGERSVVTKQCHCGRDLHVTHVLEHSDAHRIVAAMPTEVVSKKGAEGDGRAGPVQRGGCGYVPKSTLGPVHAAGADPHSQKATASLMDGAEGERQEASSEQERPLCSVLCVLL